MQLTEKEKDAIHEITQETEDQLIELNIELNTKHRRYKALLEEKKKVEDLIMKHEQEKLVVTRALEHKLEEKQSKIAKFELRISELEQTSGKTHKELEKNFQGQIDEMNRKHDNVMTTKEGQMETLDSNLNTLNQFKDTKQIREENLKKESQRVEQLKRQLDLLKKNGKLEMETQKKKIEQDHETKLKELRNGAQTAAEKNISEIERNIQEQNLRLEDEALLQEYELQYLQEKTNAFSDKNQELDQQLTSKIKSNQQIAVKQYEQNKKVKMLKTKIDLLESSLSQIVQDFEKERELIKFQNEQIIKEQNEELKSLSESCKLKNKESTNLKALCQMILDQRSDIEQFFLESLEQVKEEKRRKLEAARAAQLLKTQNKGGMQSMNDGMMNYMQNDQASEQLQKITVELSDLDWEDRERILRLLFSKMNTGQSASDWREKEEGSNRGGSSHLATAQLNQSFREQEGEEDYDDEQDAQIFDKTTVPPENYTRNDHSEYDQNGQNMNENQYYYEEDASQNQSQQPAN